MGRSDLPDMYVCINHNCTCYIHTYVICNTPGIVKICLNLTQIALLYMDKNRPCDYGI